MLLLFFLLHGARDNLVAQVLQQVVANDADDWVEEWYVLDGLVAAVASLEVIANAGSEVVAYVVA